MFQTWKQSTTHPEIFYTQPMKRKASYQGGTSAKKPKITDHQQVVLLKRKVSKLERANEQHIWDRGTTATNLGTSLISGSYPALAYSLTCPTQGDTIFDRQGSEIQANGLHIKLGIGFNPQQIGQTSIRVLVVCDKQNNGLGIPQMLSSAFPTGAILDNAQTADICSMPYHFINKDRYQILKDWTYTNNPTAVLDYDPVTGNTSLVSSRGVYVDWKFKFSKKINYNQSNTGTAGDIIKNNISLIVMTNVPVVIGSYAAISFNSRLLFKEL